VTNDALRGWARTSLCGDILALLDASGRNVHGMVDASALLLRVPKGTQLLAADAYKFLQPSFRTYVDVAARLHLSEITLYFGDDASFRTTIWQKASLWLIRCTRCALLVQSAGCAIGPSADADSRQDAGALRRSGT
jgi:hypothetical protein